MVRYQTQAVLRRASPATPLVLVGVTLDNTFFPGSAADAVGELILTKGLVALAPLTAVEAPDAVQAAVIANLDAREAWNALNGPGSIVGQPE